MEENKNINNDIVEIERSEKRPFFSIIIPCYNTPQQYIKELLFSIIDGGCKDELEIIIADGRSTDTSYQDEVKKFEEESGIPVTYVIMPDVNEDGVELVNCPGNTREYGVRAAKGQWITFIDHDDVYIKDVFTKVKELIEETKEEYFVASHILQVDPLQDNLVIQEIQFATNWMHGKFYNLDNFWKANDLHFKTNLKANEDIYVSNRVHTILHLLGKDEVAWLYDFTYVWRAWPDSTSHLQYSDELNYMEYYFYDYIDATYNVHVSEYEKQLEKENGEMCEENKEHFIRLQADALLYQFFYLQSFKFFNRNWVLDYELLVKKNIREFYKRFNLTPGDLIKMACKLLDNDDVRDGGMATKLWYNSVRYNVTISCGNFIETDNFIQFINNV